MHIPNKLKPVLKESLELNLALLKNLVEEYSPHKGHIEDVKLAQIKMEQIQQILDLF